MDAFWERIDNQLERLRSAKSADEVIAILDPPSSGDAFFAGSGGDGSVYGSLMQAGWDVAWWVARYYWAMRSPDGQSGITYVEGDVYRGVRKPIA